MAPTQDELITLPHDRYGEYLVYVYSKMAQCLVGCDADVVEIGVRYDRGILSPQLIPHRTFTTMDKKSRDGGPDVIQDVLLKPVEADVIISTCILHHTAAEDVPLLLSNLHAPILLLSGPNVEVLPELFGDHKWHIDRELLRSWLEDLGYTVLFFASGLSIPYCELLVVAKK